MPLPNFFIVGAAKSGTTALYRYLRRHPDVYLPDVKEPRFFAYDENDRTAYGGPNAQQLVDSVIKDLATYESLYRGATHETAVGDASPAYLSSPIAARRIRETVPDARIVAVLRNPVERAYSHFIDNVQSGWEQETDFERVLALRDRREREHWWRKWDYVGNGFYHEQLSRYFDAFAPDRIKVYLYEELSNDSKALMTDLLEFLRVDASLEMDLTGRHNVSGVPRSERLQRLLSGHNPLRRVVPRGLRSGIRTRLERRNLHKPEMPSGARALLLDVYREDVERLEELLGRDLSSWRR